jgi:hypothetical protein
VTEYCHFAWLAAAMKRYCTKQANCCRFSEAGERSGEKKGNEEGKSSEWRQTARMKLALQPEIPNVN